MPEAVADAVARRLTLGRRLLIDETGQDLIEYGLLAGIVASGIALVMPGIISRLEAGFNLWSNGRNALWIPPNPS